MDSQQMLNFAASSSSSSSVVSLQKYDVFLSFRGEDTRDNFISHLYDALIQKKVETYIDYKLEKGDEISQALIKAIQDSLVSLVIFSENYASSKWCLDEITKILECKRDDGQIVIPVFYKVDPSHVRKQTGWSYNEAFAKHEQDLNNSVEKLQKWRCALTEAANLAGCDSRKYRNESEFIKDIVKDVLKKLNIRYPIELNGVTGIEENYAGIESLLEIGSTEVVRVIGIWGMGGAGKTTLARALHAKLFHQFEGHCFLKHVREQSEKNGLHSLRNKLVSELLEEENLCAESHFVTRRLRRKKVLIVLDDVATSEQLEYLINDYDCLALGSRVIVTTRDKHILSEVNGIYEVKELNDDVSLHLFCLNVFREKCPKIGYEKLAQSVIAYCKGNPLGLKVLGACLRSKSIEVWKSELRKLRMIPDVNIHNVLKLSFDGLDRKKQTIFLDIACLLKGESRADVTSLLDACDFCAVAVIENIINKSLITLSKKDTIEMHELIQEMGCEIVHQESIKDPGRRSRLWDPKEVCDVLKNDKGSEVVEGIVLDVCKIKELHLSFNSFTKMTKLRILKFFSSKWVECNKIYLPNGLESFSDELRHLEWHKYCLESLPLTFCAEKLVKLVMLCSNLKKLWDGVQNLENLEEIDLRHSKDLVLLPNLSQATNLKILRLNGCISLREVHPSIFSLPKLWNLDLEGCTEIESLETEVHLKSLRIICLRNCSSLKKFSVFSKKLEELWLGGTNIHELPTSVWLCEKLVSISLRNCYSLVSFGSKSSHGPLNGSLKNLYLSGCKLLNESSLCLILDGLRSLTELTLQNCCNLRALPDTIGLSTQLMRIYLSGSINVEMLSPNMKNLLKLEVLRLDNCRKLVSLPELPSSLQQLSVINCTFLQTDYLTQLLYVVEHDNICLYDSYVILPGSQIPEMFRFRGEGDSITFPQLPQSGSICRLICCLVLSHIQSDTRRQRVNCYINKCSEWTMPIKVASVDLVQGHPSISDHVLLCSASADKDGLLDYWKTHHFGASGPNTITFEFSYRSRNGLSLNKKIEIKRCGVFPVYASHDQQ